MGRHAQRLLGAALGCFLLGSAANAADCEVLHWWTTKGESAAVKVLADSFNALGGDTWVDGAIPGSVDAAVPVIIDRIKSDNPPCAAQFITGKQADDLIAAGLMQDLTDLATKEDWADIVRPKSKFDSCTSDGKVYCVPVDLHSAQWMWTNRRVYEDVGLSPPRNWDEMVLFAPKLRQNGIIPLAVAKGWPIDLLLTQNLVPGIGGPDLYMKIYGDKDAEAAAGAEMTKVFEAMDQARKLVDPSEISAQWNDAVDLVIEGKAGATVMGDNAQAEFQAAGMVARQDYDCLAGLGINPMLNIGGDAFYFPKSDDPEITASQLKMASMMMSKPVQLAFNLKKGGIPVRADVDLEQAGDCMKIGLNILESPTNVLPNPAQIMDPATLGQISGLFNEFFTNHDMTIDQVQAQFVDIIKGAPK